MANNIYSETLALAALFQSAAQIQRVARTGSVDEHTIAPLMRALVITEPDAIEDIYDPKRLESGLNQLLTSLYPKEAAQPKNAELIKIAFSILGLVSNLEKQDMIYSQLDREVDSLRSNVLLMHPEYETEEDNILMDYDVIKLYSGIYSNLISPNFPKLIIYGEEHYLRRTELQEMIRALLLSGIRASILWHQVGGKRYSLMFRYKDIIECARNVLNKNR
ncbi:MULTISPECIES: DUF489 family protein [unclassified Anaerobiospirillum]|uniref:DUF489 family protein n=1 Tax=unclassified Anaerobiospirillum TaxID=2647410 RepID=UPI001FF275CB|nr:MULTISPECIES: DUF489 family protein [unclassified Anaerobiospirillum]MCK0534376.1 DUF489 family protein [Anaerobiospirillum sp. NML120511]MCK0539696.1 DUF489 family protein [Anaerobiospirillum sp. NML02-A-032]